MSSRPKARGEVREVWIIDVDLVSSLLRRDIESASSIDTFFVDRSGGIDMRREVPRDDARSAALDWRRGSFSPSTFNGTTLSYPASSGQIS